ncbi:uncharacterized protein LOC114319563 isoform X2 [Camellia sinensis]|uniref:uncharacterized protein LOC114319563 isoform X2 n=1 Tax=Camellia sinensis TaxID=4442 RepID=UPI001036126C|nr:uncharacterized protein LOC114319563 isoform X2 [Camellia sinensis]
MLALPRYSPFSAPYPPSASPSASPFLLLQHCRRCHISDQASAPLALLRVFDQPPLFLPSRRPHGLTRGLKVQAMVEKDGKLKVPIPHEYRAPVGDHASQLVSRIGIEVRTRLQASWSFLRNKVSKERASHELVDCFLVHMCSFHMIYLPPARSVVFCDLGQMKVQYQKNVFLLNWFIK